MLAGLLREYGGFSKHNSGLLPETDLTLKYIKHINFLMRLFEKFFRPDIDALIESQNVSGLISALDYSKDSTVPIAAAEALGKIKDPSAIAPLIKKYEEGPRGISYCSYGSLGYVILNSLAQFNDPRIKDLFLKELLKQDACSRAMIGLRQYLHDEQLYEIIKTGVLNKKYNEEVGKALLQGIRDNSPKLLDFSAAMLNSPSISSELKLYAIDELKRLPLPSINKILIPQLKNNDKKLQFRAAEILSRNDNVEAYSVLFTYLLDEKGYYSYTHERGVAEDILFKEPAFSKCKMEIFKGYLRLARPRSDAGGYVRTLRKKYPDFFSLLMESLQDDDEKIRENAAIFLGRFGNSNNIDMLHSKLNDDSVSVRIAVIDSLGLIGDQRSYPFIINALSDNNIDVRFRAIRALVSIGTNDTVEQLQKLKDDDDPTIKKITNDILSCFINDNPEKNSIHFQNIWQSPDFKYGYPQYKPENPFILTRAIINNLNNHNESLWLSGALMHLLMTPHHWEPTQQDLYIRDLAAKLVWKSSDSTLEFILNIYRHLGEPYSGYAADIVHKGGDVILALIATCPDSKIDVYNKLAGQRDILTI